MYEFEVPGLLQIVPEPEPDEAAGPAARTAREVFGVDQDLIARARRPASLFLAKSKAA